MSRQIANIDHAIGILGEQELNNLILVSCIVETMQPIASAMDITSFWQSSVFSAVIACNLSKHACNGSEDPQEYFIAGLLLNVGQLLIYYREPGLQGKVKRLMAESGQSDFEIEKEQLGFDHALVGALMAESWNFPEALQQKISRHHDDSIMSDDLAHAIVFLAGYLADQLDFSDPALESIDELNLENTTLLEILSMTSSDLTSILNKSYVEYVQAFHAFCGESS